MSGADQGEGDYRVGLTADSRLGIIGQIWSEIHISGYSGATDWAVLESLEREVCEAMSENPADIDLAESLTFKALHLITGKTDS